MRDTGGDTLCRRRGLLTLPLALSLARPAIANTVPCRALLIGNSRYQRNAVLPNTENDTRLLAQALRDAGLQVDMRFDLTRAQLDASLRGFFEQIQQQPASAAWISFAGHGVQLDGKNYLQGIDSDFSSPEQVRRFGYDLDELLFRLEQTHAPAAVVTLDACRNNPFKPEMTRGADAGLAPCEAAGVLVGFSTAPYMRALDGPAASNSPYARALADALRHRPATLEQVFRETADAVYRGTGQRQVPEYRSSLRAEWVFGATRVDLRPLPAKGVSGPGSSGGMSRGASYRPDLATPADAVLAAMTPADWANEASRLQGQAEQADAHEARQLLARGRAAGALPAHSTLAGMLLESGQAVPRDRLAAIGCYERAAVRGHAVAQMLLGELLYQRGEYPGAYKWLSAAADSGLPRARLDLAQMKFEGKGAPADAAGALRLLRQAMPSTTATPQAEGLARDLARAMRDAMAPGR